MTDFRDGEQITSAGRETEEERQIQSIREAGGGGIGCTTAKRKNLPKPPHSAVQGAGEKRGQQVCDTA